MNKLSFKLEEGKHLLIPNNEVSLKAQNISFECFEKMQYDYIQSYDKMNDSDRYINSNRISSFFVTVFLNNDGATFRSLIGLDHKGLMTMEELKNVKRDYEIACQKKKNNEFKSFLLLDILPLSNRRADAIIVTNDYNIELYDFSEGKIVEKIKNNAFELSESEQKQKKRKQKQQERIDSYKGKVSFNNKVMNDIILDNEIRTITYYNIDATFYDFNYIYEIFKNNNYETTYIPNSICFFITEKNLDSIFYARQLRVNIDSPYFITERRPMINNKIIEDIYKNNIYIGISLLYARIFIEEFTYFNIRKSKRRHIPLGKDHFYIYINKKKRFLYLEDERTHNWIPIGIGMLEKHMYMNIDLKSIMIYIAKLCNQDKDDNFAYNIIKYEKLKNSPFDFFIIDEK